MNFLLLLLRKLYVLKQADTQFFKDLLREFWFMKYTSNQAGPFLYFIWVNAKLEIWISRVEDCLLLILIFDWYPCTDGVRVVGRWCSTPWTEAKYTLDSVPIWFGVLLCTRCSCPRSGSLPFQPPSFILPAHPRPPPPPLYPFPLPGHFLPVRTTASPPAPPYSSLPHCTGPE